MPIDSQGDAIDGQGDASPTTDASPTCTDPCSDLNACTKSDQCVAGVCVGSGVTDCNDNNPCTDDACNPATSCVNTANAATCTDGSLCTDTDACAGSKCTGVAKNCDDTNPCTDDSCAPAAGCVNAPNAATCSDGNACTDKDACAAAKCAGTAKNCDDGNACTDDACGKDGACANVPNTGACSDNNPCSGPDTCSAGACAGPSPYALAALGPAGADYLEGSIAAPGGGFVAVGSSSDVPYLVRYDGNGKLVWSTTPANAGSGRLFAVAPGPGGQFAAVGVGGLAPNWDGRFNLIAADGTATVTKAYIASPGADMLFDVTPTEVGWIAVGRSDLGPEGDLWVQRIGPAGDLTWSKTWGTPEVDSGEAVAGFPGGAVVAGYVGAHAGVVSGGATDAWLLWIDPQGNVLRQHQYGGGDIERLHSLAAAAGGPLPGGWLGAGTTFTASNPAADGYLLRTDSNGIMLWQRKVVGSSAADGFRAVVATPEGGGFAAGYRDGDGPGGGNAWLVRFDAFGNVQWERSYNAGGPTHGLGNLLVGPGGLVLVGQTHLAGDIQALVVRTDPWGFASCSSAGQCATVPLVKCDDNKPCTADDCNPGNGACVGKPLLPPAACDAGQCTVGDVCAGLSCVGGPKPKLWEATMDPGAGEQFARRLVVQTDGAIVGAYQGIGGAPSRIAAHAPDGSPLWTVTKEKNNDGQPVSLKDIVARGNGQTAALGGVGKGASLFILDSAGKQVTEVLHPDGNVPEGLCGSPDGSLWIAGYKKDQSQGTLVRISPEFSAKVEKAYGDPSSAKDLLRGLACLPTGGAVAVGWSQNGSGKFLDDVWTVWVDANGNQTAQGFAGGSEAEHCEEVVALPDGGAVCAGHTKSKGAGATDGYLVRFAANGAVVWEATAGTPEYEGFSDVAVVDGGLVGFGLACPNFAYDVTSNCDTFLHKVDVNGQKLWTTKIVSPIHDYAITGIGLPDGRLAWAGGRGVANNLDVLIGTVDAWGNPTCTAAGTCGGQSVAACADPNPCTLDSCDPKTGCTHGPAPEGLACGPGKSCQSGQCKDGLPSCVEPCSDSDACTSNDKCVAGACKGTPLACSDGDPCTFDGACKDGKCANTPAAAMVVTGTGPGADQLYGVAAASDGGWLAVGSKNDAKTAWLLRLDTSGKTVWDKGTTATGQRNYNAVVAHGDGTFSAVGWTLVGGSYGGLFNRIGSDGSSQAEVTFTAKSNQQLYGVVTTGSGLAASGAAWDAAGAAHDGWLAKLDGQGGVQWERFPVGGAGKDYLWATTVAATAEIVAAGVAQHSGSKREGWALWYDGNGNLVRDRRYTASGLDGFTSVALAPAGAGLPAGFVFAGSTTAQGTGGQDGWVVRTDSQGVVLWQKTIAATGKDDHFTGVAALADGSVAASGFRNNADGTNFGSEVWIARLDALGNLQWQRGKGGNGSLHGIGPLLTVPFGHPGGPGFVTVGQHIANGTDQQGLFVRTDSFGFATCADANKCANKVETSCDDGIACTADDCNASSGTCSHANHSGTCAAGTCSEGDACFDGQCLASAKPKLWEKVDNLVSPKKRVGVAAAALTNGNIAVAYMGQNTAPQQLVAWTPAGTPALTFERSADGNGEGIVWRAVTQLTDGRIAVAGSWLMGTKPHAYVVIPTEKGTVAAEYSLAASGIGMAIAANPDGGWWLGGYTAEGKAFLIRQSADGAVTIPLKTYGSGSADDFAALAPAPGGNVAAGGSSDAGGLGGSDGWLAVVDPTGKVVVEGFAGTAQLDSLSAVAAATGGGYVGAGSTEDKPKGQRDALWCGLPPTAP